MNKTNSTSHTVDTSDAAHRQRLRPAWVIAGAIAAALLFGGLAFGLGLFDEAETDIKPTAGAPAGNGGGTDDPSTLIDAAEAAQAIAEGIVVSVETDGRRTLVELEASDGTETTVLLEDGNAEVVGTEHDDDIAQIHGLDAQSITAAFAAAVAEISGTVVEVSSDDDYEAYTVDVLTDSGVVEVDLDRDFRVIAVDRD